MKKTVLFLFLCLVTLGISSCEKEVFVPEQSNRTFLFDIMPADWRTDDGGRTWFREIDVPENDNYFNSTGQIIVSMSFEDVNIYETLPQTFQGLTYRVRSGIGFVSIEVGDPYGDPISAPNFESTAKVTLLDATPIN